MTITDVRVTFESSPSADIVRVTGEIDVLTSNPLRAVYAEALASDAPTVYVDLTEVEFIDSSGLSGLVGLLRGLEVDDRHLVVAASGEVRRILRLSGLDRLMTIVDAQP